jgi:hypothetical protein
MNYRKVLTAILALGAVTCSLYGAAVDRKDIIEKDQFMITGDCTFGNKLIRSTGKKVLLVS